MALVLVVQLVLMFQSLFIVLVPVIFLGVLAVCRSSHRWSHSKVQFPVIRLCAFLLLIRIGEASNPGPEDSCFILGVANPTGLRSKAPYVTSQMAYGDVWAFSETHLCSRELASFNAGLKFAGAQFQPLVGGHPVPTTNSNTGCWKGVGVLAKTPVRKLPHDWPSEIAQSSRALAVTTMIDDVWLSGGVVYGEPESHLYPDRLRHTEALLQAVVGTIGFLSSGPRFVAGDWNVHFGELPVFDLLARAGFRDLQELAEERWGIVPKPTCKHRTRKDFCFISPELQSLLLHVSVVSDVWPDHAILQGHFARLSVSVPRDYWRMPGAFPWPVNWDIPTDLWLTLPGIRLQKSMLLCGISLKFKLAKPCRLSLASKFGAGGIPRLLLPDKLVGARLCELVEQGILLPNSLVLPLGMLNGSDKCEESRHINAMFLHVVLRRPMLLRCGNRFLWRKVLLVGLRLGGKRFPQKLMALHLGFRGLRRLVMW